MQQCGLSAIGLVISDINLTSDRAGLTRVSGIRMAPYDLPTDPCELILANAHDRAQVAQLAAQVQEVTDSSMVCCVYARAGIGVVRAIASRDPRRG
jgi:hypothetical protein